jgi:hypothetical protein
MLYRHHSTASAASSARKLVWGSWIQVMLNFEGRVAIGRQLDPQISGSIDKDHSGSVGKRVAKSLAREMIDEHSEGMMTWRKVQTVRFRHLVDDA